MRRAGRDPEGVLAIDGIGQPPEPPDERERLRATLSEHFAVVWRALRRFGVPQALVDDAALHVFYVLSNHLAEVPAGKERAFLLSTALRVAANERRKAARSRETPSADLDSEASGGANPEQLLDWKERRLALDDALSRLPLEQRAVFVLFELEGFSLPEIAETLSVPLGTATSRLRRARVFFEGWVQARPEKGVLR